MSNEVVPFGKPEAIRHAERVYAIERARTLKALAVAHMDAAIAREEAEADRSAPFAVAYFQEKERGRKSKGRTFTPVDDLALSSVGAVSLKKSPDRLVYDDPTGAFFAWAAVNGEADFVRCKIKATVSPEQVELLKALVPDIEWYVEREVRKDAVRVFVESGGAVPPGFKAVPGGDELVVAAAVAEAKGRKERVAALEGGAEKEELTDGN
jgi:hypothetical protein